MSPQQLDLLLEYSNFEQVPANKVLVDKIADCPGLALILSGELRISKISSDGREVTLYRVGRGRACPLSVACIVGNLQDYSARVIAEADTLILWVSRQFVSKAMVDCEPFWRYVFGCLAKRLFEAMDVVDNIAFTSIKKRLAQILINNSGCGENLIYTTHEALARELGTAREVISRELKGMERAGILRLSRGLITVDKPEELIAIVVNNGADDKQSS